MKTFREIGIKKILFFNMEVILKFFFGLMFLPPFRVWFLKLFGSQIGKNVIIHNIKFINVYRGGFKNLKIGDNCFLSDDVLLDLADKIILEDHATIAVRANILTHTNVGYKNHPLQKYFPSFSKPVILKKGSFVGINAVVLPGIKIGENSFIGAGAVVTKDIPNNSLAVGVPAKVVKILA